MKGFRIFYESNVKQMIMGVLDPRGDTIDSDSKEVLARKLSEFQRRDNLLTDPMLSAIINKSGNRGAIIQALGNDTTTIGNLLSLIGDNNEKAEPARIPSKL